MEICGNIDYLIEGESKAISDYTNFMNIIDIKYKDDIAEILKDEEDHLLKLNKIKEDMNCQIVKQLNLFSMKNMTIEEIISLYRLGYRL